MLQPQCSCLKESIIFQIFCVPSPQKKSQISWFILGSLVNNSNPFKPSPLLHLGNRTNQHLCHLCRTVKDGPWQGRPTRRILIRRPWSNAASKSPKITPYSAESQSAGEGAQPPGEWTCRDFLFASIEILRKINAFHKELSGIIIWNF